MGSSERCILRYHTHAGRPHRRGNISSRQVLSQDVTHSFSRTVLRQKRKTNLGHAPLLLPTRGPNRILFPRLQNITLIDTEVNFVDGDAVVIRSSTTVSIDAGPYDE